MLSEEETRQTLRSVAEAAAAEKVLIAGVLPQGKRNTAFGLFYIGYGVGWLIGSVATGLLYDRSQIALIIFVVAAQLISLPLFVIAKRQQPSPR